MFSKNFLEKDKMSIVGVGAEVFKTFRCLKRSIRLWRKKVIFESFDALRRRCSGWFSRFPVVCHLLIYMSQPPPQLNFWVITFLTCGRNAKRQRRKVRRARFMSATLFKITNSLLRCMYVCICTPTHLPTRIKTTTPFPYLHVKNFVGKTFSRMSSPARSRCET